VVFFNEAMGVHDRQDEIARSIALQGVEQGQQGAGLARSPWTENADHWMRQEWLGSVLYRWASGSRHGFGVLQCGKALPIDFDHLQGGLDPGKALQGKYAGTAGEG